MYIKTIGWEPSNKVRFFLDDFILLDRMSSGLLLKSNNKKNLTDKDGHSVRFLVLNKCAPNSKSN